MPQPDLQLGYSSDEDAPTTEHRETDDRKPIQKFLRGYTTFDLIPDSGKVIVLDSNLSYLDVVFALGENELSSAPIWNSMESRIQAMCTITDIIKVAIIAFDAITDECSWHDGLRRAVIGENLAQANDIFHALPDTTLFDSLITLETNKKHRLPVLSKNKDNVLHIISHRRIIRFLVSKYRRRGEILAQLLDSLPIGTVAQDIISIRCEDLLIDTMKLFIDKRISVLPVVDGNGCVIELVSKSSLLLFFYRSKEIHSTNLTVDDLLSFRVDSDEGLVVIEQTATLEEAMSIIAKQRIHRVVMLKADGTIHKLITVSDIMGYFVD
ncbi:hypothetical protein PCE1_004969 [Barthelona sp. PCE]